MRGAIQNVPLGEIEAARACGMSKALLYRRIIFPRAFRLMLPAYSNEVIFTLQASALASIVTFMDLTGAARVIIAKTFGYNEVFIPVAAMYLVLTYLIDWGFRKGEYRLSGHLRERSAIAAGKPPVAAVPGHWWSVLVVGRRRVGGAEGNRTPDLLIANEALSHLSYSPTPRPQVTVPAGLSRWRTMVGGGAGCQACVRPLACRWGGG